MPKPTTIFYIVAIGTASGVIVVYLFWWAVSRYKLLTARERPLRARKLSLWREPGEVERLDFRGGPGGREREPLPPFRFVEEHATGSNPCMSVHDARGLRWRVKWGDEVKSETFAVRVAWAAGYHVEAAYFVSEGHIDGAENLTRARTCVAEDFSFHDARFELDEEGVRKLFDEHGWSWDDNPFVGTRELAGLKILLMLVSNWDNKDVRDVARGSNTAIFEHTLPDGTIEARYLIIDWGATLGKTGSVLTRTKWDCEGFSSQNADFIHGVEDGIVQWSYTGQRTDEASEGITVEDVRWLHSYVGRITDRQLREGLLVSGATEEEADCFTRALRERIERLGRVGELGDAYRPAEVKS
ncbi:MAG: hypothetical protein QOC61_361 [Acidobacteriota bacterium]|jgi:hypothetical protein|nr:hypothetical protein [Acidobacteriota bacterium]MDT5261357.1 hypothetical protein [Acidobacteriota bacterium]